MRLVRLTLVLLVMICLVIATSRLVGGTQAPARIDDLFTGADGLPCDMPCMFGMRPNVTDAAEMLQIVGTHPFFGSLKQTQSTAASGTEYQFSDQHQNITILLDTRNIVQSVHWLMNDCLHMWLPTVADLINVLGRPSAIVIPSFGPGKTYVFQNYEIAFDVGRGGIPKGCVNLTSSGRLDPHEIVVGVYLEGPAYFRRYAAGAPWRGFRSARFYFTQ